MMWLMIIVLALGIIVSLCIQTWCRIERHSGFWQQWGTATAFIVMVGIAPIALLVYVSGSPSLTIVRSTLITQSVVYAALSMYLLISMFRARSERLRDAEHERTMEPLRDAAAQLGLEL